MVNIHSAPAFTGKLPQLVPAFKTGDPAQRLRALLGVFLMVAMAVGAATAGPKFLNDPDTLWHIAVGKDIWLLKAFPHVDAYSHSFGGEPWIAKEWLSQLILFGAYSAGGWNGVAMLAIAILLLVTCQLYGILSRHLRPILAVAVTAGCLTVASDVFVARPHIVALPLIIVFVQQLWTTAQNQNAPSFWMLGVLCVWSNLHASFTFGFVAAFLAFLFYLHETRDFRSTRTWRWVVFLGLCPVAAMVHPYGFESIWSTVTIVESEALPYISEWRAFSLPQDTKVELFLLVALMATMVSGFRINIASALFLCLLLHMYLTHTRFTYLLFTLAPLLLVKDIATQFKSVSFDRWARDLESSAFEQKLANSAGFAISMLLALLAAGGAAIGAGANWTPPGTSYPVQAIKAARDFGVHGNVLNDYNFGGALIFEGERTFIDGRADRLFQDGFIPSIADSMDADGDPILRQQISDYDIGWSIINPADGRVVHMDAMPGWERIFEDEFAVVHAKSSKRQ